MSLLSAAPGQHCWDTQGLSLSGSTPEMEFQQSQAPGYLQTTNIPHAEGALTEALAFLSPLVSQLGFFWFVVFCFFFMLPTFFLTSLFCLVFKNLIFRTYLKKQKCCIQQLFMKKYLLPLKENSHFAPSEDIPLTNEF